VIALFDDVFCVSDTSILNCLEPLPILSDEDKKRKKSKFHYFPNSYFNACKEISPKVCVCCRKIFLHKQRPDAIYCSKKCQRNYYVIKGKRLEIENAYIVALSKLLALLMVADSLQKK